MENFTVCDFCKYLTKCKEKNILYDITIKSDTTRHYILGAYCKCPREDDKNDRKNI